MNKFVLFTVLLLSFTGSMCCAAADTGLQSKMSLETLNNADLGGARGGDINAAALDIKPWIYWQKNLWRAYGMVEFFGASDRVEYESSGSNPSTNGFMGIREAWVDYTGFTPYPGEYLRSGLQRVRSDDGLWWDTDIEASRWVFNTTLIDAEVGIAQRLALYRSDKNDVPYQDDHRLHIFGKYRYQWRAGHWIAARFHRFDDNKPTPLFSINPTQIKDTYSNVQWLGIELDSDYYHSDINRTLNYQLSAVKMDGQYLKMGQQRLEKNIGGTMLDALLRYRINQWQVGAATSLSSGEITATSDNIFLQTGLESNRSAFTGTRARILRFGEAYRPSLGNINVYSLFVSLTPVPTSDISVIFHKFTRRNALAPTVSAVLADQVDGESDLGQELDLVFSWYLNSGVLSPEWALDDRAYVRLRGGVFESGPVYDKGSRLTHLTGEFVWLL